MGPKFTRDVTSVVAAQVIIALVSVASAVIMARALGAEGRGQFTVALLLGSTLATFTDFGLGVAASRFSASKEWPARDIFASNIYAWIVQAIATFLIGLALVLTAKKWLFPGVGVDLLILGLLHVVPLAGASLVLPILVGLKQSAAYSKLLLISSVLPFTAILTGWMFFGLTVASALSLQLVSTGVASWLIYRKVIKAVEGMGEPTAKYLSTGLRFGVGLYISNIANFARTRLVLLMINGLLGPVAVGLYTIAQTASDRLYLLADAAGTVLMPRIAEDPKKNSRVLTPMVFRMVMIVVTFISGLVAVVAEPLVKLLFTEAFLPAVPSMHLLLISGIFASGWRVISQDLNARSHTGKTAQVNAGACVSGLALSAVLIPHFGIEGAAGAAAISAAGSLGFGIVIYTRIEGAPTMRSLVNLTPMEVELADRVVRRCTYLVSMGPGFWWAILHAHLIDELLHKSAMCIAPFRRRWEEMHWIFNERAHFKKITKLSSVIAQRRPSRPCVRVEELGLPLGATAKLSGPILDADISYLGEFDHYGRLESFVGPILGMIHVTKENAEPRRRSQVFLISIGGSVFIEKKYAGSDATSRFVREVLVLERLSHLGIRVPELIRVNVNSSSLIQTFVPGPDMERLLEKKGARLTRTGQPILLRGNATLRRIHDDYVTEGARIAAGLERTLLDEIHRQVTLIHRVGVELYDLKYGNIIIHSGSGLPYLVDFDSARIHNNLQGRQFLIERDRDIGRLNQMLGANYPCLTVLRRRLRTGDYPAAQRLYSSSYIGHGIKMGNPWDISTGFGRWNFILKAHFKNVKGARILSLGPNNGSIELSLLRAGAAEVIAYEQDSEYAAQGRFLTAAHEWADNREYRLKYINAEMREAASESGKFDCVLALCSLYYLSEEEMARLLEVLSKRTKRIILQCNVRKDIARDEMDQYRRASVAFNVDLLKNAGYEAISIDAPFGYSRPIVEGQRL